VVVKSIAQVVRTEIQEKRLDKLSGPLRGIKVLPVRKLNLDFEIIKLPLRELFFCLS
jgi:hypothetical protein